MIRHFFFCSAVCPKYYYKFADLPKNNHCIFLLFGILMVVRQSTSPTAAAVLLSFLQRLMTESTVYSAQSVMRSKLRPFNRVETKE